MLIGYFFDNRFLISTKYSLFLLLTAYGAICEDFWLPKNHLPKISALTVRPRNKKSEFSPLCSLLSAKILWTIYDKWKTYLPYDQFNTANLWLKEMIAKIFLCICKQCKNIFCVEVEFSSLKIKSLAEQYTNRIPEQYAKIGGWQQIECAALFCKILWHSLLCNSLKIFIVTVFFILICFQKHWLVCWNDYYR